MMQVVSTISVVDRGLRVPHCAEMLSHHEIREEMIRQLDAEMIRPKDVAAALGIPSSRVAEMRRRERRVQYEEMQPLAEFLGITSDDASPGQASDVLSRNIRALRAHLGLNQTQFAARVGSSQSNVSKWEGGVTPEADPLEAMAQLAGCTIKAFKNSEWKPPQSDASDHAPTRTADAGETADILAVDLSVAMGPGVLIDDFVEQEPVKFDIAMLRKITRSPFERLRLVTGIGNSHEPKFYHGDQFLIDINDRQLSRIDGYYWITLYGAHALKRLRPVGKGRILIISENPDFEPQEVDAEDIRIEGRAVWVSRGL